MGLKQRRVVTLIKTSLLLLLLFIICNTVILIRSSPISEFENNSPITLSGKSHYDFCLQYILPAGIWKLPVDTINKSFQLRFRVKEFKKRYTNLYDTTNTLGIPTYGHKLVLQSDGTIYLQDWTDQKVVLNQVIEVGIWYYICVVIERSETKGIGRLYLLKEGHSQFMIAEGSISNLGVTDDVPIPVLGAMGNPKTGKVYNCFCGEIYSFSHWEIAIKESYILEIASKNKIVLSDHGLLGYYSMRESNSQEIKGIGVYGFPGKLISDT
jgi:hypothetical protein